MTTQNSEYTHRLQTHGGKWWKKILNVQAPYRWNLRRLQTGYTLDLGCGLGRNLRHLAGNGVGIDHNPTSVQHCKNAGLKAFTPSEFKEWSKSAEFRPFDTLLLAHVAEHMTEVQAVELIREHLPFLHSQSKIVLITPQKAGYLSDPTHVEYMDLSTHQRIITALAPEANLIHRYSFPFPSWVGNFFKHNEHVTVARLP